MPNIRPSSDLWNHYNEISEFCNTIMQQEIAALHQMPDPSR